MKTLQRLVLLLAVLALSILPTLAQDQVTHTVQSGENLFRIALKYGVDINELARVNNITDQRRIFSGQILVIPGIASVASTPAEANNPLVTVAPITHVVQRGDTLKKIAAQYNVTLEELIRANNITNPDRILVGQSLQVWSSSVSVPITEAPAPTPPTTPPANAVYHTVRSGEYLSGIARVYGVSWTRIAEANNITDANRVFAGMRLLIPDPAFSPSSGGGMSVISGEVPPARIGKGREVVVILSQQMAYAFEDGVLQRAALVSTGLPATPTVTGDYKIYLRYTSQNMSGPGYYLPNVPYVMYFYQGYGLHGTYWHNNFGQPMSRGCVNMRNDDAEWFFNFTAIGTPVHVRWAV
jgi:LysM repeat protein